MRFMELVGIAASAAGVSKEDAARVITAAKEAITGELGMGGHARLPAFGTFTVADRAASEGRNPRTGEPIHIPAKRVAKFKPAAALTERLNPTPRVPRMVEPTKRAARGR